MELNSFHENYDIRNLNPVIQNDISYLKSKEPQNMIKAIIIDDEKHCIETLKLELQDHIQDIEVIATANSGEEGIELIEERKPDLVFLDIEMPFMNGFEMLKRIQNIQFDVIFVTAYNEHAVKAFKFSAMDYLMKPVHPRELMSSIDRFKAKRNKTIQTDHLDLLLEHLTQKTDKQLKIAFSTADGVEFVFPDKILRCEASGNYCQIFKIDGDKIIVSKPLKDVQNLLSEDKFFRVHQSHLINIQHVKKFIKTDGGHIIMDDGSEIAVARSKKEFFLNAFQ